MEVGRVCVKIAGHEAGRKCVVIDVIDKSHVLITGPSVKRRRCNIRHLEPLEQKLDLEKGASDEEVKHALELAGLVEIVKAREKLPEAKESTS
jgi:large subunit ribosomal protein L14e